MSAPRIPRLRALWGGKMYDTQPPATDGAQHPDFRRDAALRAAFMRGFSAGERTFYPRGWRRGAVDGAIGSSALWILVLAAMLAYVGGWRPW